MLHDATSAYSFFEMLCWSSRCLWCVWYDERTLFWSHQFNLMGQETPTIQDQERYVSICPLPLETSWVQALTCIKLNNSIWENLREYNSFCHLWSVVTIFCQNTGFLLEFGDLDSAKVLSFLKTVSAMGEGWQSCVTISAQWQNNSFTGSRSSCRIVSF